MLTRRRFGQLSVAGVLAGVAGLPRISLAANPTGKKLHGLSAFGELKYPPDYTHFDYVNPDAPKGGTLNFGIPSWLYNQNPADLRYAQYAGPERQCAAAHGDLFRQR